MFVLGGGGGGGGGVARLGGEGYEQKSRESCHHNIQRAFKLWSGHEITS